MSKLLHRAYIFFLTKQDAQSFYSKSLIHSWLPRNSLFFKPKSYQNRNSLPLIFYVICKILYLINLTYFRLMLFVTGLNYFCRFMYLESVAICIRLQNYNFELQSVLSWNMQVKCFCRRMASANFFTQLTALTIFINACVCRLKITEIFFS